MKLPFTIHDSRFAIWKKSSKPAAFNRKSSIANHKSSSGIALVITLILLSVTLVMALAFLAITNRERGSVTTESDTATARLAADAALAHAEAQIMANILSTTNPYSFGLIVSTNYINPIGFQSGVSSFTNVNYVLPNGAPITGNDFLQNLTNLLYLPRAPVYFPHQGTSNEFRFFLNLNQNLDANGNPRFDANGIVPETDNTGAADGITNFQVGDPEWIGGLERPDASHGPNNRFLYRYAFIAVPVGNTLDANYIYNYAKRLDANMSQNDDSFYRNEGVGSWELNLAAFLTDLNTNQWNYDYVTSPNGLPDFGAANSGTAFNDALSLLRYRYGGAYNNLATVQNLFGANGSLSFQNDNIDGYSDGPLMFNSVLPGDIESGINPNDDTTKAWSGADNTNHFFTPGEFFNPAETATFSTNLLNAGTNNSSYDRYTFYRLLSQLGTDSSPESGKMNINYDNLTVTNGAASGTNFLQWTALGFFTNAADRMLRSYTAFWMSGNTNNFNNFTNTFGADVTSAFGVTNIPVYVEGRFVYSPAVQRLLQLAANIYDASTTNFYPSRFKPIFRNDGTNVFIVGYEQQTALIVRDPGSGEYLNPDLAAPADAVTLLNLPVNTDIHTNVYGVPWIIGAKKGLPNFNEFSLENAIRITRKLQYSRDTNHWQWSSNQMYIMSISNYFGVECWNSYHSNYLGIGTVNPGMVDIMVRDTIAVALTNDAAPAFSPILANTPYANSPQPYTVFSWPAYSSGRTTSFLVPLNVSIPFLTNSIYNYGNATYPQTGFIATGLNPLNYRDSGTPPLPHFGLLTTNRLQVAIVDYSAGVNAGQIIDYVQLNGMDASLDINAVIADPYPADNLWSTNLINNGEPDGVDYQTRYSKYMSPGPPDADSGTWPQTIPGFPTILGGDATAQASYFNKFFTSNLVAAIALNGKPTNIVFTSTNLQAPYTPTRTRVQHFILEANDPLIHYLTSDLTDYVDDTNITATVDWTNWPAQIGGTINEPNARYAPWGKTMYAVNVDLNPYNMAFKDPLVSSSDYWDFPTNKFPTVGWLGRVHRGTPWQTVYLKASNILTETNASGSNVGVPTWQAWTGNQNPFDANNFAPAQDRFLFDIFTTAFNDNATRGQLSVNVAASANNPAAGLAAWSAVFSGVVVPPISPTNTYTVIAPVGNQAVSGSPLGILITNINYTRAHFTNADGLVGTFEHVGDILAVPQMTQQSPFLNLANTNYNNDELYEWLPQQTMSLLRVGSPRYVIYSYGQALKPAPNSIVTSSSFFGMVTNYQVMAETATRAVVRFDSVVTNNPDGSLTITNNNAVIESFNILPPDQN